jgi:hypothetical protein
MKVLSYWKVWFETLFSFPNNLSGEYSDWLRALLSELQLQSSLFYGVFRRVRQALFI